MEGPFTGEQKKAITHFKGPAMVLAGPGSGKTLVITNRVRWLIEDGGVDPSGILVITFTRAAAMEMKNRFFAFQGMEGKNVWFGTFHSAFFMILRYAYRYHAGNIIKEEDRKKGIRSLVEGAGVEIEDENDFLLNMENEISYVKGEMMSLSCFHSSLCSDDQFLTIYQGYEKMLRSRGLIDFDDMPAMCYELFRARPDILAMWQKRFPYILIDEFQDINRVQYENVRMLAGKEGNVFIVGDDDQSIYRFRGARPELMAGFEKDYPGAKKIILGTNYRCSSEIVEVAGRLIRKNRNRYQKTFASKRGPRVPVTRKLFADVREECDDIVKGIAWYKSKGIRLSDMAVIYRTNTQPRLLLGRMMEAGIPFRIKDRVPDLFEHWIARDLFAYIALGRGSGDRASFLRIMNRPKRYISRSMLTEREIDFRLLKEKALGKYWLFEKIEKLEADLALLGGMGPYAAIRFIRRGIGYEDYLKEYADYRKMDPAGLFEVLDEIHESARDYGTFEEWFSYIRSYRETLREGSRNKEGPDEETVTLTTMHSAKGLEYEVVFIIDVNEGVTPHRKAVKDADIEEERRLFYVALTRAKTYLFLYSVRQMYQKDVRISRFMDEIR